MPSSFAVVLGLYVLSGVAALYGLVADGITVLGSIGVAWPALIVVLLARGNEGARMFVMFSAMLTVALGAMALLASMVSGQAGAVTAIGLVWLAIGWFTYATLGSQGVQMWMANRLIARMDSVTSGRGTRP
jgi:hypothetical protein